MQIDFHLVASAKCWVVDARMSTVLVRIWKPHLNLSKSSVINWSCLQWASDMELVVSVLLYLPGIAYSYETAKIPWAAWSKCILIFDSVFCCLFYLCFFLGKMAKRTFSVLETFLIFLLVMMTAITVALLTLLFITSGTIENHKGKCDGLSWMLCLSLQQIPWLLGTLRQEVVSADNADDRTVQYVLMIPGIAT